MSDVMPISSQQLPLVRVIRSRAGDRQLPDLLHLLFAAELVQPSRCLWLISPWITDVPILDNRSGAFTSMQPAWPRLQVRLADVLEALADRGATIRVATRPVPINEPFVQRLERAGRSNVRVARSEALHEKGLLGDTFYLGGSMNFTGNGITIAEEAVQLHLSPQVVAEGRVTLTERWGGPTHG
jgi:hypothetical protein